MERVVSEKGFNVGECLMCVRNSEEFSVVEEELRGGREREDC